MLETWTLVETVSDEPPPVTFINSAHTRHSRPQKSLTLEHSRSVFTFVVGTDPLVSLVLSYYYIYTSTRTFLPTHTSNSKQFGTVETLRHAKTELIH